jgi:hypothetical protein
MLIKIFKKIIAFYNIILIIFGTLGNILTCIICLRRRLKKVNTFKLFALNAIMATISLYEWNLRQIILYLFEIDLIYQSLLYCQLTAFLQYVSFESSAWFLVKKS